MNAEIIGHKAAVRCIGVIDNYCVLNANTENSMQIWMCEVQSLSISKYHVCLTYIQTKTSIVPKYS